MAYFLPKLVVSLLSYGQITARQSAVLLKCSIIFVDFGPSKIGPLPNSSKNFLFAQNSNKKTVQNNLAFSPQSVSQSIIWPIPPSTFALTNNSPSFIAVSYIPHFLLFVHKIPLPSFSIHPIPASPNPHPLLCLLDVIFVCPIPIHPQQTIPAIFLIFPLYLIFIHLFVSSSIQSFFDFVLGPLAKIAWIIIGMEWRMVENDDEE